MIANAKDEATKRDARLSRGETLFFLGRNGDAVDALDALAKEGQPGDVRARALYYAGRAALAKGDTDAAGLYLLTLMEALPQSPLAPFAQYQIAQVYLKQDALENAAIAFSTVATSAVPDTLRMESQYRAAEIYDKMGWFSAAVGAYEKLRDQFPGSAYAERAEYGYAWALYHAGKYDDAIAAADRFLKANDAPEHVPGLTYLRGNALQRQSKYKDALTAYADVRKRFPESPFARRAHFKTAWTLWLNNDAGAAKTEVTSFLDPKLKRDALTGDAAFLLGQIFVAEGNYEAAQTEFQRVAQEYPKSEFAPEALFKSAECLDQLGLRDQAAEAFAQFANTYAENELASTALLRTADAAFAGQRYQDAVGIYRKLLEAPSSPEAHAAALYRLAVTLHNLESFEESRDAFARLLEVFPETEHKAEALYRIGSFWLRHGDDALKAIEGLQAALDVDAKGAFAGRIVRDLALARFENKDFDKAAEMFLRLVREHPVTHLNEESYLWAAQWFFGNERWDEASALYSALLDAFADYPYPGRVRLKVAECAERAGRPEEAIKQYASIVESSPASNLAVEAQYQMARTHEALKQIDEAKALYQTAASSNMGDAAARSQFRLGELQEAEEAYADAARSFMRVAILYLHKELSPEALFRAGENFARAGQPDQADKAFEEIMTDFPESEFANKAAAARTAGTE